MAGADVFFLANGGRIDGQLLNTAEQPRRSYVVKTDGGAQVTLSGEQVRKFVPASDAEKNYQRLLPRMPDSADGNWIMSQWCLEQGLDEHREQHLMEVLRHDPNHKDARLALGYTSLEGRWVKTDEWMRERGFIYHQGKWRTPQEAAAIDRDRELELAEKEWKKRLRLLRGQLGSERRAAEAVAELRKITDPLAGNALAELYEEEDKNPVVRLLWVEVLGKNPSGYAIDALVKAAVEDNERQIRDAAQDQLAESKSARAVGGLLFHLDSKDNKKVNRAAAALGRIQDPESFLPLVEALVTEHKFIVQTGRPGGSMGATFTPNGQGGTGFSAGGGPKVITRQIPNSSVLDALVRLVNDNGHVNFQYDKERWKTWYADVNTPDQVNLRRDP